MSDIEKMGLIEVNSACNCASYRLELVYNNTQGNLFNAKQYVAENDFPILEEYFNLRNNA
jgi:hypothetical protein